MGIIQFSGARLTLAGVGLALWCALTFAVLGRGTPLPFDPPRRLVMVPPRQETRRVTLARRLVEFVAHPARAAGPHLEPVPVELKSPAALVRAPIADIPSIFKLRKETLNQRVHDRFSTLIKFQVALCDVSCV